MCDLSLKPYPYFYFKQTQHLFVSLSVNLITLCKKKHCCLLSSPTICCGTKSTESHFLSRKFAVILWFAPSHRLYMSHCPRSVCAPRLNPLFHTPCSFNLLCGFVLKSYPFIQFPWKITFIVFPYILLIHTLIFPHLPLKKMLLIKKT